LDQLRPIRQEDQKVQSSQFNRYSLHDLKNLFGIDLNLGMIRDNKTETSWPNRLFAELDQNFMGFFQKSQLKLELVDHGLVRFIQQKISKMANQERARDNSEDQQQKMQHRSSNNRVAEAAEAV